MGGSQSVNERLVISREREDEAFNIVRVSEDAIRTLRGEQNTGGTPTSTNGPAESTQSQIIVGDEKLQSALNDERLLTQRLRQDLLKSQHELKEINKKLSALERDAKDAALSPSLAVGGGTERVDKIKQAESYYRQKLDELMDRERRRQVESSAQFKESLERLQQRFLKYSCHTACAELESKVLQCYLQNPGQTLRCDSNEYIQCVDEYRAKLLSAKDMAVSAN